MMMIPLILQRQACAGAQCIYSYCHETSAGAGYRAVAQKGPTTMTIHTAIKLPAQNLGPKAFAPYGEIIRPRTSSAETAAEEPKLTQWHAAIVDHGAEETGTCIRRHGPSSAR
jgi:hypothetical protein